MLRNLRFLAKSGHYPFIPLITKRLDTDDLEEECARAYDLSGEYTLEVEFVTSSEEGLLRRQSRITPRYRLGYATYDGGTYWEPPSYDYATGEWNDDAVDLLVRMHGENMKRAIGDDLMCQAMERQPLEDWV